MGFVAEWNGGFLEEVEGRGVDLAEIGAPPVSIASGGVVFGRMDPDLVALDDGVARTRAVLVAERGVGPAGGVEAEVGAGFTGGIVRSGSKVGSKYKTLKASTNHEYCPSLQGQVDLNIPTGTQAVYEIVIDGLSEQSVADAMKAGLHAAAACEGILLITAGNYGGKLGKFHFHLKDLL